MVHIIAEPQPHARSAMTTGMECFESRRGLRKEGVALHLHGADEREHNKQRAQAHDGSKCTEEIQDAFEEVLVHTPKKN